MKQQYTHLPFLDVFDISEWRAKMASVVPRPGRNLNCTAVKMSFSSLHFINRELINKVKKIPTWETNEIPR